MNQLALGIVIGIVLAYTPTAGCFIVIVWLEGRARKRALDRLLAKVAIADYNDNYRAW